MATPAESLVIYPDREPIRVMLLFCMAFSTFGIGVALFLHRAGWLPVFFFGFGAVANGFFLVAPLSIRVSPEGFTARSGWFYHASGKWSEVEWFRVEYFPQGISIKYRSNPGRRIAPWRWTGLYDEFIGFPIGQDMEHVASLLNDYRVRFGTS